MDKRKYQSKTLIAEYYDLGRLEDFRFKEKIYRIKDGSLIMEFDGKMNSLYGVRIGFCKCIARKGICSIKESEYKTWKEMRQNESNGYLIDWENEMFAIMDKDFDDEELLKCVGENDLPF